MHRRACSTIYKGKSSIGYFRQTCHSPPPLFLRFLSYNLCRASAKLHVHLPIYESNELNMNDKFGTELPARTSLVTPLNVARTLNLDPWTMKRFT